MIISLESLRDTLNRVIDIIDIIAFRDSVEYKDYKRLLKVEKHLFNLSYAIFTDNNGILVL